MDTKKLRQKILDLAIRGKLVPQDPNDEPASVLLERIRAEKEQLIKEGKIKRSKKSAASDTSHYENVPFEVPEGWAWCRLEDIAYVAAGSTPSKESFVENGVPYIKMYNLRNQKIDFEFHPQYITEEVHNNKLARSRTQPGDLLMNIVGPPLGKLAIIPESLPEANFNQAAVLIRPFKFKPAITQYLFYYLSELSEINSISTKGSAGQVNISLTQSQQMRIALPPLAELERITQKIESLFSKIGVLETSIDNIYAHISKIKSGILEKALSGKLVSQDKTEEPAITLLKSINPDFEPTDNRHYENLPDSWEEVELGDVCQLFDGEKVRGKEFINLDVKYLRGSKDGSRLSSGKYVPENALMILVDGENSGEVFTTPHEGYQGSTFKQLRISSELNRDYVLLLIQRSRELLKDNKVGSAIPHLNKKLFKQIHVPIPPYDEQSRIVRVVQDAMNKLDEILADL